MHYKKTKTYLLPILLGFESATSCAPVKPTENWRIRSLGEGKVTRFNWTTFDDINSTRLDDGTNSKSLYSIQDSLEEFGINGVMIVLDTVNGVYNDAPAILNDRQSGLLHIWKTSETESFAKFDANGHTTGTATSPSSASLIIQVWLHTICMWRKRCINRRAEVVHTSGRNENKYTQVDNDYINSIHKQTIIDINKGLKIYINDGLSKREFRGYHMTHSDRCGHFRHLNSGRITYVIPTTVYYKRLIPSDIAGSNVAPIIYRNTEDFLREKSYLENDVMLMLRGRGINFKREQMFPWMGRKRLDFYLPDLGIAIECQGVQHFYKYGHNDKDLNARKKRDEDKYNECKNNGIRVLYFVNPDIPIPQEMSEKYTFITDLDELYKLIN